MDSILTLSNLITQLSESSLNNYKNIFKKFKPNRDEFVNFENWSRDKYTRNCIYKDDNFELILLCWDKNQKTSIHFHGGAQCWIYLLEGELDEVYYNKEGKTKLIKNGTRKIAELETSYINDSIGLHQLKNSSNSRAMSLHLYAKPIENCTFYDETSQSFLDKKLSYDTFIDVFKKQKK